MTPSRFASQLTHANSSARFAAGQSERRNASSPDICHSRYSFRMQPICPSAAGLNCHNAIPVGTSVRNAIEPSGRRLSVKSVARMDRSSDG
jgi:hypothetical protein